MITGAADTAHQSVFARIRDNPCHVEYFREKMEVLSLLYFPNLSISFRLTTSNFSASKSSHNRVSMFASWPSRLAALKLKAADVCFEHLKIRWLPIIVYGNPIAVRRIVINWYFSFIMKCRQIPRARLEVIHYSPCALQPLINWKSSLATPRHSLNPQSSSFYLRSAPSVYVSSATSVKLPHLGCPRELGISFVCPLVPISKTRDLWEIWTNRRISTGIP